MVQMGKSGSVPAHLTGILERFGIRAELWPSVANGYDRLFGHVVGTSSKLIRRAQESGRRWYRGLTSCVSVFG
jgi:hypothetical protein